MMQQQAKVNAALAKQQQQQQQRQPVNNQMVKKDRWRIGRVWLWRWITFRRQKEQYSETEEEEEEEEVSEEDEANVDPKSHPVIPDQPSKPEKVGNIDSLVFLKEYAKDPRRQYVTVAAKLGIAKFEPFYHWTKIAISIGGILKHLNCIFIRPF
jgi:hypothetical protein